jgi:gluconokinase
MVVILMGASGSGKTAVGEALAARLGWTFEDGDNWHPASNVEKMRSGHALTDDDRVPWIRSLNRAIQTWLAGGRDVVLACSALKRSYREGLRSGLGDDRAIRFVYLKRTYEEIDRRLRERHGHFMPESLLKSQFAILEEPDASEALILHAREPAATIVSEIVDGLQLIARPRNPHVW